MLNMNIKAKASDDFRKNITNPVGISFKNPNESYKNQTTFSMSTNDKLMAVAKAIVGTAKTGDIYRAQTKLVQMEKLYPGNIIWTKVKEKLAQYKQELKGLSFIQKAQEFMKSEKQDGLLHDETLEALQDLVITGENLRTAGETEKADEIDEIISQFAGCIQKIKPFSQETRNFQILLGLRAEAQKGMIDQDTLIAIARFYLDLEKSVKAAPQNQNLLLTFKKVKSFLANLEAKTSGGGFKVA